MTRKVLCPSCFAVNEYPVPTVRILGIKDHRLMLGIRNEDSQDFVCCYCDEPLALPPNDFQRVEFVEMNDGYHSWFSQPTSIHTVWRCTNRPMLCGPCVHNAESDMFCRSGRIDIRKPC